MEEYEDKEEDLAFAAKINKDIVSLRIPREKDDWELFALKSLEVTIHLCLMKSLISYFNNTVAEKSCG